MPASEGDADKLSAFRSELKALVARDMGKPLAPSKIHFVSALPKTRNAKVIRRVIRSAYLGEDAGDLSAAGGSQGGRGDRSGSQMTLSTPSATDGMRSRIFWSSDRHGVGFLCDVRGVARSRWPQFNGMVLGELLRDNGIGYEHLPETGGRTNRYRRISHGVFIASSRSRRSCGRSSCVRNRTRCPITKSLPPTVTASACSRRFCVRKASSESFTFRRMVRRSS